MSDLEYQVGPRDFTDWAGLHALLRESFAYMEGRIDPPSSLEAMTTDSLRRKTRHETLMVVFHAGRLVACGFLEETERALYLGKLAVRPALRRRGILRGMIERAEDHARRLDKPVLQLQARIELVENHRTFAALGFVRTGETCHPGYDRPTSVIMTKQLCDAPRAGR